eukprot:5255357-Pleurochrysis_carterae.AAC.2
MARTFDLNARENAIDRETLSQRFPAFDASCCAACTRKSPRSALTMNVQMSTHLDVCVIHEAHKAQQIIMHDTESSNPVLT